MQGALCRPVPDEGAVVRQKSKTDAMKTNWFLRSLGVFAVTVQFAAAQPADIRQGLVAFWPMESTDGATTADATPFLNNLSLVGMDASSFVPGKFGNAANFNGSSSYLINLHSPDNAATGLPIYRAGRYTIAMWVKGPAQTAKYLFTEGNNTGNNNPLLILQTGQAAANNGKFDVIIRNDAGGTGGTPINHVVSSNIVFDNTWHHIAWVDNNGQARLYVDGNPDAANFNYTPAGTYTFQTTVLGNLVRAAVAGGYFSGQMDDVAVWERPLSQAEVQDLMNNSLITPIPVLPPYISLNPTGGVFALGDRAVLSVQAVGNRPLSYQWYKGLDQIPGAISSSLTLLGMTPADSGDYAVVVTGSSVSVTSTVAAVTVVPDPEPAVRTGLVSLWPMESLDYVDPNGYSTPDVYSSNTMRLISTGFFDQAPGKFGTSMSFNGANGTDQYGARQGGFPIYNNSAFSVALWVNGTNQADRRVFAESSTNSTNPLFALGSEASGTNHGGLRVYIRSDANSVLLDRTSAFTAFDGNWHHVVWTETNGRGRLYIDGVLDNNSYSYTRGTLTLDQTAIAAILRSTVSANFSGLLDEVAVWSRAISFTEIQEIMTNGVPPPIGVVAPEITQNPASQSVLTRTKVNFSFFATGTSPLEAQWRRFATNLPGATNFTLTITNVAMSDAGDYDVVVVNSAGSATSQVATLTVALRPDPPTELAVDFNNTGSETAVDTETGFLSFAIPQVGTGPFTKTFGGADVTLTAVGTTMETRLRTVPSNSVDFTEEKLLRDFVFTRDAAGVDGQGLDVAVQFMEPNQPFTITLWSFDSQSASRISDWYANGTLVRSGYAFVSTVMPTSNDQYRFSFDVTSDAEGSILIQGRRNSASTVGINVFLNAMRVVKPQLRILKIEVDVFGDLVLTIQALNPAATHRVVQKASLADTDWTDVTGVNFSAPSGNIIRATFTPPTGQTRFYRVVQD